jgi:uncharacterized membrane protein
VTVAGEGQKVVIPFRIEPWFARNVLISGVFEIALGALLLVPQISWLAAWGLIALLIAVFPANIYLYQHQEILPSISPPLGPHPRTGVRVLASGLRLTVTT